jgi:hypothetical protein
MDNRQRARKILEEARELLADRLVEQIVESGDGILEDAEGYSYMDEIDSLQERIGGRLNNINVMIGNLPASEPVRKEPMPVAEEAPVSSVGSKEAVAEEASPPVPVNFALFGQQIAANDIDGAGRTLSELLDVDQTLARRCATAFRDRLNEDPTTIQKTMRLRSKLMAGEHNDSLMILWDCFGLQGLQAVTVLQTLRASMAAT